MIKFKRNCRIGKLFHVVSCFAMKCFILKPKTKLQGGGAFMLDELRPCTITRFQDCIIIKKEHRKYLHQGQKSLCGLAGPKRDQYKRKSCMPPGFMLPQDPKI